MQNAKAECDKVIDKNGPPPIGTGIKQLRENIAESKLSYEIMDDAGEWNTYLINCFKILKKKCNGDVMWMIFLKIYVFPFTAQAFLKIKIMDNIHKYFYLITFTAYLREQARSAVGGITDDQKKDFGLTGGKG